MSVVNKRNVGDALVLGLLVAAALALIVPPTVNLATWIAGSWVRTGVAAILMIAAAVIITRYLRRREISSTREEDTPEDQNERWTLSVLVRDLVLVAAAISGGFLTDGAYKLLVTRFGGAVLTIGVVVIGVAYFTFLFGIYWLLLVRRPPKRAKREASIVKIQNQP